MASNILIKRSTGSVAPGSITFGELAITTGANGTQANAQGTDYLLETTMVLHRL